MQYIGDETILSCITMPYELLSRLAQRINAACGGDKINSLLTCNLDSAHPLTHQETLLVLMEPWNMGPAKSPTLP